MNTIEKELLDDIKHNCIDCELVSIKNAASDCMLIVEKYAVGFAEFINDFKFHSAENFVDYYVKITDVIFEINKGNFDYNIPKYNHSELLQLYIQSIQK